MCRPASRSRASAGPASFEDRPPPAAGFTIAKKRSIETLCVSRNSERTTSQRLDHGSAVESRELFRQYVPLYLKRCRARKVLFKNHDSMNALVVEQTPVQERNRFLQLVVVALPIFQMDDEQQLLSHHGPLRPDVIRSEHAKFLHRQRLEHGFDVFGIDVLPFFGDDHVFLAPEELQMPVTIKAAQVASAQPPIDDRFGGQFRLV